MKYAIASIIFFVFSFTCSGGELANTQYWGPALRIGIASSKFNDIRFDPGICVSAGITLKIEEYLLCSILLEYETASKNENAADEFKFSKYALRGKVVYMPFLFESVQPYVSPGLYVGAFDINNIFNAKYRSYYGDKQLLCLGALVSLGGRHAISDKLIMDLGYSFNYSFGFWGPFQSSSGNSNTTLYTHQITLGFDYIF